MQNNEPNPEPLIFPRGVRFPRKNEIPGDPKDVLERVARARIMTGYVVQKAVGNPFNTYIEANVHAPQIFDLFRKLTFALMPDAAAPLIGVKEDEPVFGPYTYRDFAIGVFEPYIDLLQNDGFLEFGLLHQSKLAFEEIFVASSKYFKIWTNNSDEAENVLRSAGIPRSEHLEFIDEYPVVSTSINKKGHAAWAAPFYAIQDEFAKLPEVEPPTFES